jgi:hypothetical protein
MHMRKFRTGVAFAAPLIALHGYATPAMAGPAFNWSWMQHTSCRTLLHMKRMPPVNPGVDIEGARYMLELYKSSCRGVPPNTCIIGFVAGGHKVRADD